MTSDQPQPASRVDSGSTAVVIPSLGSPVLEACLDGIRALDPAPDRVTVVVSGGGTCPANANGYDNVTTPRRIGFAAAVNLGINRVRNGSDRIAILNDDAVPPPNWLGVLGEGLEKNPRAASAQGTITNRDGTSVDGRGIGLDRWMLPVQLDRGSPVGRETQHTNPILAVSGTAALFRRSALIEASAGIASPFDPRFGSYHEDMDLGLRLQRLGWGALWVGGAPVQHHGSVSGGKLRWRHPWWVLANRWRALAGNLTMEAFIRRLPRLLRGELRAIRTLTPRNPRTLPVAIAVTAAWPILVLQSWNRPTPGPRLTTLPEPPA